MDFNNFKIVKRESIATPALTEAEKLKIKEEKIKEKKLEALREKAQFKFSNEVRYIISCDPFSEKSQIAYKEGLSIFFVYDKINYHVITEIKTKKPFQAIVEDIINKAYYKSQYAISDRFIKDGKAVSFKEAKDIVNGNNIITTTTTTTNNENKISYTFTNKE